jgi:sodium pump decarboxylase gamma subunit
MKKFLALTCMIACIFGLTACGDSETLTDYEQNKMDAAIYMAENQLIPTIQELIDTPSASILNEYTPEEVEYTMSEYYSLEVDGYAFVSALDSFASTYEEIGGTGTITDATATINDDQIIVNLTVEGPKQNAEAEIVFSNDFFFTLEAASLNTVSTMGDSMAKAALNTLLGMGTVFVVLILISLIISCFGFIPKLQAQMAQKKENGKSAQATGIDKAVAQINRQEESAEVGDDLELVAVIAAAIAASEGAASTDGFVVRSIKRRKAY